MKNKYNIDGKIFSSKKKIIEYIQVNIIKSYKDCESLSTEHLRFMIDLLKKHPWCDQKIGCGVTRIWLQKHPEFRSRSFWLERIDGTKTDFSYYQCLQPASPLKDFKSACRRSVADDILKFKNRAFFGKEFLICPISGVQVTPYNCHVDHAPPTFDDIVTAFIQERNIDVSIAPIVDHSDGNVGKWFTDKQFAQEFVNFHNGHANLRILSAKANLSLSKYS